MQVSALPGSVEQLLAVAEWAEYHLAIYRTSSQKLIILNDGQLLQVLPIKASAVSVHPISGNLAVCTTGKLVVYESVQTFGHPPHWILACESSESEEFSSVSWMTETSVAIIIQSSDALALWDTQEQRIVREENVGYPNLTANPRTGCLLVYNDHSVILFSVFNTSACHFTTINGAEIVRVWYVTNLIAVDTARTLFLYSKNKPIASIPHSKPVVCREVNESSVSIDVPGCSAFELSIGSVPELRKLEEKAVCVTATAHTSSRLYTVFESVLKIFDYSGKLIYSVSGIAKPRGNALCCGQDFSLLGGTLFDGNHSLLGTLDVYPVHVCFLDKYRLAVISSTNMLVCYIENKEVWTKPLEAQSLGVYGDAKQIVVVFKDRFAVLNAGNGAELTSHSVEIDAESAAIASRVVAIAGGDRVSVFDLSGSLLTSTPLNGRVDKLSVTPQNTLLAYTTNNKYYLKCFENNNVSQQIEFKLDAPVLDISWDTESKFAAVLTPNGLRLYASVPILKGMLRELPRKHSLTAVSSYLSTGTKVSWTYTPHKLIIFNGEQAWVINFDKTAFETPELAASLPVYASSSLILIFEALRPDLVTNILAHLLRQLKFGESNEEGQVNVHLPFDAIDDSLYFNGTELLSLLDKNRVAGLTEEELTNLKKIVEIMDEQEKRGNNLDPEALCALVLNNVQDASSKACVYAWFSDTKLQLKNEINTTWHIWLDRDALCESVEQKAKVEFAQQRDPTAVTIYYFALHKLPVVQTLWKISAGHPEREKTMKLFNNDFTTERWKSAARKNAYALLSKHRNSYAAAFFLLGDAPTDCCQLSITKMHDTDLAIVIARVYDGNSGRAIKYLQEIFFASSDPWLYFWCSILLGQTEDGLKKLKEYMNVDPFALFVYANNGGQFDTSNKQRWVGQLVNAGLDKQLAQALVNPLEPKEIPITPIKSPFVAEVHEEETPDKEKHEEMHYEMPKNLKPPPTAMQLEPDMSAFGF